MKTLERLLTREKGRYQWQGKYLEERDNRQENQFETNSKNLKIFLNEIKNIQVYAYF